MRIAIDARELAGQPTGVGRFLGEILRQWADMPEAAGHEFIYCAPAALAGSAASEIRRAAGTEVPAYVPDARRPELQFRQGDARSEDRAYVPDARRPELQFRQGEIAIEPGGGTLWEQRVLPRLARRANADVLFCPAYSGPMFGGIPLVVAIHDVSFAAHPEWFGWREGLRRRIVTRRAARRASRIITISEFSRREIVEHLGVPPSKVEVIYPGASRLRGEQAADVARDPLILYVGSIFNRRHVPETIRAFGRLARRHPDARFTIVGDNRTFPHVDLDVSVDDAGQRERVITRSYVPDADLAELYGRARAFVFLSEYEGFGLTPLEALASGIPIVVLDTPVAREVYGPAARYVAAPDPRLIEPALEEVLYDASVRARLLQAAPAVVAKYSWQACARTVLDVLVRA
jgi:glycosyltransferase involved in cell wall biosynthesis